jgi:hypothetical protein
MLHVGIEKTMNIAMGEIRPESDPEHAIDEEGAALEGTAGTLGEACSHVVLAAVPENEVRGKAAGTGAGSFTSPSLESTVVCENCRWTWREFAVRMRIQSSVQK